MSNLVRPSDLPPTLMPHALLQRSNTASEQRRTAGAAAVPAFTRLPAAQDFCGKQAAARW